MKKIMILNGSGRPNGSTSALVKAFRGGAESVGHEVREFFLQKMNIHGCINCLKCARMQSDPTYPCSQRDDMAQIYDAFLWCDVVVFASPVYWFAVTGTLKTAVDRLYAIYRRLGVDKCSKKTVLLMTSGSPMYEHSLEWYYSFEKFLHWESLGAVLGADKIEDARLLGSTLEDLGDAFSPDDLQ